jgi:drug/metabolite transporter (DMT)-like permease
MSSLGALDPHHISMAVDFVESATVKPFIIPVFGLIIGAVMMNIEKVATVGKLVLYFGAQSFMNIFMAWVFHTKVTVPQGYKLPNGDVLEHNLYGCPVGFALTALQQVISFLCFILLWAALYFTKYRITPKPITSVFEVVSICIFGSVFALNIALNNFSLGYISIALNLIIRSCLPLTTFLSQQGMALCGYYELKPCRALEISLMVAGCVCAGAFTLAQILGSAARNQETGNIILGVMMCIASLLCGSLNLALAGVLGEMKLSVYDTVAYMSIPAFVFLLPFALFLEKPIPGEWPTVFGLGPGGQASDWQILQKVMVIAPDTFALFALSGVFSFMYNIVQFSIVHTLSPSATAFGGNFNKAALVFLTLILPFLQVHALPGPPYIYVIWLAVLGNVAAFSLYSYLQIKEKQVAKHEKLIEVEDSQEWEGEDESASSEQESGLCGR